MHYKIALLSILFPAFMIGMQKDDIPSWKQLEQPSPRNKAPRDSLTPRVRRDYDRCLKKDGDDQCREKFDDFAVLIAASLAAK